ncbi:hypothetical protein [Nonomuraea fuscirosea]|uniref:hypothetical protein n=1 Tax=Nonomuraea fuscirosea TaxID=1291556 RepID=UPI0033EE2284
MSTIYNRLVATGDPSADAALRLSSTISVLTTALIKAHQFIHLGQAQAAVVWPPAATPDSVGYMKAYQVATVGPNVIEEIRELAEDLTLKAHARDEWTADRVWVQMNREADPTFTPEEIRLYTMRNA